MNKTTITVLFLLLTTAFLNAQTRNPLFQVHDRGNLWQTMKDNGTTGATDPTNRLETYPSMDWPGGPEKMNKDDQRSYLYASGMWISGKKSDGNLFFTENGPFSLVDDGTFDPMVKTNNFIGQSNYDPSDAEQKIVASWKTSEKVTVKRTSRVWSFPGLNNFVIIEYTLTNSNTSALSDVYVGFPYLIRPSYQDFVVHNGWGDDFNRTDDYAVYDSTRALLYAWDDTPNFSLPGDVGNYYATAGELRTTGYAGYSLLHADPASDGRKQPAAVLFGQLLNNERFVTSQSTSIANMYNLLNGTDKTLQSVPGTHLTPFMLMSCGPYNFAAGATVKIVIVEAVNGLPIDQALLGLEAQALLPAGADSLKSSIDQAKLLYQNNYKVSEVPPPSPDIDIYTLPAKKSIALSWEPLEKTWVNPISGKSDFLTYRVYRSNRAYTGPFKLMREIVPTRTTDVTRFYDSKNNRWFFEDSQISLGVGYFYSVTSVDSAGNESWLTNRNKTALTATRSASVNTLNVKVFPNPFKIVSGFPTAGTENYIIWSNLPAQCKIKIYTSSGEQVRALNHDNANSGEETWDQLSDSRQRTAPGIYFWTVESSVGNAQGTLLMIK